MFTSLYSEVNNPILCYYLNQTNEIQSIRISNIPNWYFEKVVFPKQRLMFEAFPEAILEIHTGTMVSAILSDKIQCHRLRVQEEVSQFQRQASVA